MRGALLKNINANATCATAGLCNRIVIRLLRGSLRRRHTSNAMFSAGALINGDLDAAVWRELLLGVFVNGSALVVPESVSRVLGYYEAACDAMQGNTDSDIYWASVHSAVDYVSNAEKTGLIGMLSLYLCAVHDGSVPARVWTTSLAGHKLFVDMIPVGAKEAERHMLAFIAETLPQLAVEYSWDGERFVLMCFLQLCLRGHLDIAWAVLQKMAETMVCFEHLKHPVSLYMRVHEMLLDVRDPAVKAFPAFGAFDRTRAVLMTALLLFTRCAACKTLIEPVNYVVPTSTAASTDLLRCDPHDVLRWQNEFRDYVKEIPPFARMTPLEVSRSRVVEHVNITRHRYDPGGPLLNFYHCFVPKPDLSSPWLPVWRLGEDGYNRPVLAQQFVLYHCGKRAFQIKALAHTNFKLDAAPKPLTGRLCNSAPLLASLNAPTLTEKRELSIQQRQTLMAERNIAEQWMIAFVNMHFCHKPNQPRNLVFPSAGHEYTATFEVEATHQLLRSSALAPMPPDWDLHGSSLAFRVESAHLAGYFEGMQKLRSHLALDRWGVWTLPGMRNRPLLVMAQHSMLDSEDNTVTFSSVTSLKHVMSNEPCKFAAEVLLRVGVGRNRFLTKDSFITNLVLWPEVEEAEGNPHRVLLARDDALGARMKREDFMRDDEQEAFVQFFVKDSTRNLLLSMVTAWKEALTGLLTNDPASDTGSSGGESLRNSLYSSGESRPCSPDGTPPLKRPRSRANPNLTVERIPDTLPNLAKVLLKYLQVNEQRMQNDDGYFDLLEEWLKYFCC